MPTEAHRTLYNFSPGPAILPREVLEAASQAILNFNGSGLSVLEVSHRGKEYEPVHEQTQKDMLELMGLSGDEYSVLFMGGGASTQFAVIPMNYLTPDGRADYVNTGEWASRAIVEARRYGGVEVVASSEDRNFNYIPRQVTFHDDARYIHLTSNNTIFGTAWHSYPDAPAGVPQICDMSSDFLAYPTDFSRFDLIYAGAQKNAGPAGVTVVVIRKSYAERANKNVPTMFSYPVHVKNNALYNTPPVFSIYVVGQVMKWIKGLGGLQAIEAINRKKAETLYGALDGLSGMFRATVPNPADRSWMNIPFRLHDAALEAKFLKEAEAAGFVGLKGHRSVGGCRASIYNAFPQAGVDAFVAFMHEFARKNG